MSVSKRLRKKIKGHDEWLIAYADLLTNLLVFFAVILAASQMNQAKMQKVSQAISGQSQSKDLAEIQKELNEKIKEKNYENIVVTELGDDGLRVFIDSGVVFRPGQAEIPEQYALPLSEVMKEVLPYVTHYQFAVEGHADTTPLSTQSPYRTNWDLSAARAQSILFMLKGIGIGDERLHTEGYGSSRPLPEDRLTGLNPDQRLAKHRRVVIRVY